MIWSPSAGRLSYRLIRVTNANSIRRYFYRPASPGVAHTSRRRAFLLRTQYLRSWRALTSACAVTGWPVPPHPLGRFRVPGVVARRPASPPSARRSRGLWGSPTVRSSGTTIGSAASYEQPASSLAYWAAPSLPDAVGARNGSQRVQTSPDPARRSQNLLAGEGLPVRLSPTV